MLYTFGVDMNRQTIDNFAGRQAGRQAGRTQGDGSSCVPVYNVTEFIFNRGTQRELSPCVPRGHPLFRV